MSAVAELMLSSTACNGAPTGQSESELTPPTVVNEATLAGKWLLSGASTSTEGVYEPGQNFTLTVGPESTFELSGPCALIDGNLALNEVPMRADDLHKTPFSCDKAAEATFERVLSVIETLYGATLSQNNQLQLLGDEGTLTFNR